MPHKQQHGRQIFNKFFLRDSFITSNSFETAINEIISYLEKAWWLCKNPKTGQCGNPIIQVHRNKHGARIIAYNSKNV